MEIVNPLSIERAGLDWATQFLCVWRSAWAAAPPDARAEATKCFRSLEGPTSVHVLVRRDEDSPVTAFAVVFVELSKGTDAFTLTMLDAPSSDGMMMSVQGSMEHYFQNMRFNWFPGRAPDPPLNPWSVRVGPLDERGCAIVVPGAPVDLNAEALVTWLLRIPDQTAEQPPIAAAERDPPVHLFHMKPRERSAIERLFYGYSGEFMRVMGLPFGWWCFISPLRSPLCQRRVRQSPLDISVLTGGEWCLERAEANTAS